MAYLRLFCHTRGMENTNNAKEFLSLSEVGARLGVSRETARRFVIQQRRIPYVRHGRSYRVPVSAWEVWLTAQHDAAMATTQEAHG